jgi:hypothetical protein
MDKQGFRKLFETALEEAAQIAGRKLNREVPRNFQILLHGLGYGGTPLDLETAVDTLYLGEDSFFFIVDVAVVEVNAHSTKVFVRPSGHRPVPLEYTWNYQAGTGPFKQLIPEQIKVVQTQSH